MSEIGDFLTTRLDEDEARIEALDDPQAFPQRVFYQSDPKAVIVEPWAGPKAYVYLWLTGAGVPDWKWVLGDDAVSLLSPELLARARAEVAVKRAIIARHGPHAMGQCRACEAPHWGTLVCNRCYGQEWPCADVRDIAGVYRAHPSWREEWATGVR